METMELDASTLHSGATLLYLHLGPLAHNSMGRLTSEQYRHVGGWRHQHLRSRIFLLV